MTGRSNKTKKQLIDELESLRRRVAELEGQGHDHDGSRHRGYRHSSQLSAIVKAFEGYMYVCSQEYRIEFMNERLIKRTGSDSTGEHCYKVMHDRDAVCPWCVNERVFKGEIVRCESKIPKDDSWVYVVHTPIQNEDGTISKLSMMLDISEPKRIYEAILKNEESSNELVQNANSIILRMDKVGNVTFFNDFAQRFFGYSREEIVGKHLIGTIVPEIESTGRDMTRLIRDIGLNPEHYINNVNENMRSDGERVWIAWTNKPIRDDDGRTVEVLCIGNDITEVRRAEESLRQAKDHLERIVEERTAELVTKNRELTLEIEDHRRTEQALRDSEEKYRGLVDHIGIGVALINQNMEVLTLNTKMKEWFPNADSSTTQLCYKIFRTPPRDTVCSYCPTFRTLQDGGVYECAVEVPINDANRHLKIVSTPIRDTGGMVTAAIQMVEDITETTKMQEKLQESEAKYRTIFETTASPTIIVEEDTTVSLVNAEFEKQSGYSKEEVEGKKRWTEFVYKDDLKTMLEYHRLRRINPQAAPRNYEARYFDREGRKRHASVTIAMFPGTARSVISLLEISERKLAEEALQDSESQLRHLSSRLLDAQEEERKRIARDLHDSIGQSLVAIKLSVENVLKTARESTRSKRMVGSLEPLLITIQSAVEETRRICTGLRPSLLDDLGLITTIGWFCRNFSTMCPNIRIEKVIGVNENDIPEPLKIVMFRILQEALNNVVKYSKAETVCLSLTKSDGAVVLTIQDNGVGFNLDSALSKDSRERGLGLSGMRERTELSGGSFVIESNNDHGTKIRARWPCPA